MPAYLAIEDLSVRYGATTVLDGVGFEVAQGELIALLGSSGCGKTTLLRSVAGFVPVARGRILVAGRDITHLPPEARQSAMMFQSYALWPHMDVTDNIGYGLKVRGWKREAIEKRVEDLLRLLKLEGMARRDVAQLSGGQRQRVAMGRALAVDPALLLLDEPMSNLDHRIRLELRHELRALQQRVGITTLHVTHDREEALTLADRIVVLDAGRIAQIGTPEDVFHRPSSPFVASFMGADNRIELAAAGEGRWSLGDGAESGRGAAVRVSAGRPGAGLEGCARAVAYFRSEGARLARAGSAAGGGNGRSGGHDGAEALVMRGRVAQTAYLGQHWRHRVQVGAQEVWVNDEAAHAVGEELDVVVPASALHVYPAGAVH